MTVDTEHLMERLQQNRNLTDQRGRMLPGGKQTRFLTYKERKSREDELVFLDGNLNQPTWINKGMPPEARKALVNRRNHIEDDLKENAPPDDITGGQRDAINKLMKEQEEKIRSSLLSSVVMRRNPAGAVDRYKKGEGSQEIKTATQIRRNCLRLLDRDNDDKDYGNNELLRPSGVTEDMATSMMLNSQIPGHHAMTSLAKMNWPENMPEYGTVDSALKQVERRELTEQVAQEEGITDPAEIEKLKERIKTLQLELSVKDSLLHHKVKPGQKVHKGTPWTCDQCGQDIDSTRKGVHLGRHAKEAKAAKKAEVGKPEQIVQPDVVLVGGSRSSKTEPVPE